jgi:hypothetical protein
MTQCLNTFLALDLVLMIQSPFKPKSNRISIYFALSALFSVSLGLFNYFCNNLNYMRITGLIWVGMTIIYFCCSLYSIIYASVKLSKGGFSIEVRNLVLKRHILTVVAFLVA